MHNKVGVVGINLDSLKGEFGTKALMASGNNFGNMLFTNAAYRQVNNCKHIGFNFDLDEIKNSIDSILIPAANWINERQDWSSLADLLEETNLPVTVVGLGAQLDSINDAGKIQKGTKRFLKVISSLSEKIGVRGEFTEEVLHKVGVKNTVALGCPSIFNGGSMPMLRNTKNFRVERIGVGPTRYNVPNISAENKFDKQRGLYQFGLRDGNSIYFQSEACEVSILNREEVDSEVNKRCALYYGVEEGILHNGLLTKGKYHTSLDQWINDVKKEDFYIGTRIHGVIAATLAGTPAVLITHDRRTEELAKSMSVPSMSISDFRIEYLHDIKSFISLFDFEKYIRKSEVNYKRFQGFYKSNNLMNNFSL